MDIKSLKLLSERNRKRLLGIIYNAGAGHTVVICPASTHLLFSIIII